MRFSRLPIVSIVFLLYFCSVIAPTTIPSCFGADVIKQPEVKSSASHPAPPRPSDSPPPHPLIKISGVNNGAYYNHPVAPRVDTSAPDGTIIHISLNGVSYVPSLLQEEGDYTLSITASDSSGAASAHTIRFTIDTTAPSISVENIDEGASYNRDIRPDIDVRDNNIKIITASLNGAPYSPGNVITAEGAYTLVVSAIDSAGNTSSFTRSFKIDKTPPSTSYSIDKFVKGGNDMLFVTPQTRVTVKSTDKGDFPSGTAAISCSLDGSEMQPYSKPIILAGLDSGTHTISCQSSDKAGNRETEQKLSLSVSNSSPVTVLTLSTRNHSDEKGHYFASPDTIFTLFASGAPCGIARTEYRIDGGKWTFFSPFSIPADGRHTIEFKSVDRLGNEEDVKSVSVLIEKNPPETTLHIGDFKYTLDNDLYVSAATVFKISAASRAVGVLKSEYRIDNKRWIDYEPFTITTEGKHLVEYRSIDAVGNFEPTRGQYITVDTTPPTTTLAIDSQQAETGKTAYVKEESKLTLSATDKLSGVKKNEYRIDQGKWLPYAPFKLPPGSHTIEFKSIDNVDNEEEIKIITVKTDTTPPITRIEIGKPMLETQGTIMVTDKTQFTLSAAEHQSGIAKIEYRIDAGKWVEYAPFTVKTPGVHLIEYRCEDKAGNIEPHQSLHITVDTSPPITKAYAGSQKNPATTAIFSNGSEPITLSATGTAWELEKTLYKIDEGPWTDYEKPIMISDERTHTLQFRSIDKGGNEEPINSASIIVDKSPPISTISISGPQHEVEGILYIEAQTVLTPSASDAQSGIGRIQYQIVGHGVENDAIPFSIATKGSYEIRYWSIDKAGNKEEPHNLKVVVSAAPKKFEKEDMLITTFDNEPAAEAKKEPTKQKATATPANATEFNNLQDMPQDIPVRIEKNKPLFSYLTLAIVQIGLIIAVMLF